MKSNKKGCEETEGHKGTRSELNLVIRKMPDHHGPDFGDLGTLRADQQSSHTPRPNSQNDKKPFIKYLSQNNMKYKLWASNFRRVGAGRGLGGENHSLLVIWGLA